MTRRRAVAVLAAVLVCGATRVPSLAAAAPRWVVAVLPSGHEFSVEVAADAPSRQRGYMGRAEVGPREGMLFVFDNAERHSFWMRDCKVPLDIVWLDDDRRVVWIAPDRMPCPPDGECPSIVPPFLARYVIEFAGGTAASEGLKRGDPIVLLGEAPR